MIERFSEKDIKGLLVLSKLEKWDYSEADLHTIFQLETYLDIEMRKVTLYQA